MSTTNPPKALLFDCFGTVVDWRSTVTRKLITSCSAVLNSPSIKIPSAVRQKASSVTDTQWGEFASAWRESYGVFVSTFDPTTDTFISVDEHHLQSLHKLLNEWGLEGLYSEEEVQQLSLIWHFLDPWPDSSAGIALLNSKFITATLSNGNVSLLEDMAEFAHLPWTEILSSAMFGAYKPHPSVYIGAAEKLGLKMSECAMVAAHLGDLKAARMQGFQTIYVERSGEEDFGKEEIEEAKGWVDLWVALDEGGFLEVAKRLGCHA